MIVAQNSENEDVFVCCKTAADLPMMTVMVALDHTTGMYHAIQREFGAHVVDSDAFIATKRIAAEVGELLSNSLKYKKTGAEGEFVYRVPKTMLPEDIFDIYGNIYDDLCELAHMQLPVQPDDVLWACTRPSFITAQ